MPTSEQELPLEWNITGEDAVKQGTDWLKYHSFGGVDAAGQWATWNLTGYTLLMAVRRDYDSPIILELTDANGRLSAFETEIGWSLKMHITASVTKRGTTVGDALVAMGVGVYDCAVIDAFGHITPLFEGKFAMKRSALA